MSIAFVSSSPYRLHSSLAFKISSVFCCTRNAYHSISHSHSPMLVRSARSTVFPSKAFTSNSLACSKCDFNYFQSLSHMCRNSSKKDSMRLFSTKSSSTSSSSKSKVSPFEYSPDFQAQFSDLLESLYNGLLPMKEDNEIFELTYEPNKSLTLDLDNTIGTYTWIASPHANQVMMMSPASGVHQYVYNANSLRWEDVRDHHILIEILVRELLMSLRGLPAF